MGIGVNADLVEEVSDTFRRDGRLAGIGEGLGVIDLLLVERRQHPGDDTSEFGVCVCRYPETLTPLFSPSQERRP